MTLLVITAAAISIVAAVVLVFYLIKVIKALRSITAKLANARILLLTTSSQTAPATDLVGGIGSNVSSLHQLVTGVARSLGLSVRGHR